MEGTSAFKKKKILIDCPGEKGKSVPIRRLFVKEGAFNETILVQGFRKKEITEIRVRKKGEGRRRSMLLERENRTRLIYLPRFRQRGGAPPRVQDTSRSKQ